MAGNKNTHESAFAWTAPRIDAARLVAEDALFDEQIAATCGVTRKTLHMWKTRPAFQARVKEHVAAYKAVVLRRGIAQHERRVDALNDRWRRMKAVIDARAEEHGDVPGGDSGLYVKQIKSIGAGPSAYTVDEYVVDTGLLNEMRQHEKQAAQEVGQWVEKSALTDPTGKKPYKPFSLAKLTADELDALDSLVGKIADEGGDHG